MKKYIVLFIIHYSLFIFHCNAQNNKSGNTVIFGGGGIVAEYNGTALPTAKKLFATTQPYRYFLYGHSTISDSATGKIRMLCNGYVLYDTLGNIMENGDSLVPSKMYHHNSFPDGGPTQNSLILPKGSNGLYYIFNTVMTDSSYDHWLIDTTKAPCDLLHYHIVDINANNGLGKVIQKNTPLIQGVELNKVGMMACRHANGYDWWLLKQGSYDSTVVYKILVTADTVVVKDTQVFASIKFGPWDVTGQSCFSKDGKKYAYAMGKLRKLFIADFDRCSGELRNPKVVNIPIDSTTHPGDAMLGRLDSFLTGLCFSPNDSFIYVNRSYNIYQYELYNNDSTTAWYRVKHGEDTTLIQFEPYMQMHRGIDNRIYIGKWSGTTNSNSVIDKPNIKGVGCNFCRKCFRHNVPNTYTCSPSNMPDFTLGADSSGCKPAITTPINQLIVYPNPAYSKLYIKNSKFQSKKELYNSVGQLILTTTQNEINVSQFAKGLYIIKCEGQTKKVIIE